MLCFISWAFLYAFISRDCGWQAEARAWIDQNENRHWDDREQPLSDVAFYVDDVWNKYNDVAGSATSNENGVAQLFVWLPGCPFAIFEVYADIPSEYRLTTQPRQLAFSDGPFLFGFIKEK